MCACVRVNRHADTPGGNWMEMLQGRLLSVVLGPSLMISDPPGGEPETVLFRIVCSVVSRLFMFRMPSVKRVSWPLSISCSWRMVVRSCC